ncbi:hypothetical protein BH11PLA2_BH11PLA2_39480 [soil metagenome]
MSFEMSQIESLENFWSLKRGISNPEMLELEGLLCPEGVRGDVTSEDISYIEKSLGIRLPDDYKTFLKTYGFAAWFGHTILGIPPVEEADVNSYNFSVIDNTKLVQIRNEPNVIENLLDSIVIGHDQMGGFYLLDPADADGVSTVRHIEHEEDFQTDETWPSFLAYLEHFYEANQ